VKVLSLPEGSRLLAIVTACILGLRRLIGLEMVKLHQLLQPAAVAAIPDSPVSEPK